MRRRSPLERWHWAEWSTFLTQYQGLQFTSGPAGAGWCGRCGRGRMGTPTSASWAVVEKAHRRCEVAAAKRSRAKSPR